MNAYVVALAFGRDKIINAATVPKTGDKNVFADEHGAVLDTFSVDHGL